MKPDLDAIRARCEAATPGPWASKRYSSPHDGFLIQYRAHKGETETVADIPLTSDAELIVAARTDIPALLAYIDELERQRNVERERADDLMSRLICHEDAQDDICEDITHLRRANASLEHMVGEERENVDTLRARVTDLESEAATLRHRDALLKRVHGALADMCCRVPTSIDEPVDAIIRLSLARANQRFVDEYDLRVSAQEWANDLRAELFDWQHAVEYVLGDNWCSADGHDAKAARKALAEWAAKAQGEAPQLLAEIAELKARITTLEAMR